MQPRNQYEPIKVFVAAESPLEADCLVSLIKRDRAFSVEGSTHLSAHPGQKIAEAEAEVIVLSFSTWSAEVRELLRLSELVQMVAIIPEERLHHAIEVIQTGVSVCIHDRDISSTMLEAVRCCARGEGFFSETIREQIVGLSRSRRCSRKGTIVGTAVLSPREVETFALLGRGLGSRAIADQMALSIKTVQAYCGRMKEKLNLRDLTGLQRCAFRWDREQEQTGAVEQVA